MWLIKVQYIAYKAPRWVVALPDMSGYECIQKSRKTATQFKTREAAEKMAATLGEWDLWKIEVIPCF